MNFGDTRDVQRRLRHINRRGAVVRYTSIDDEDWIRNFPCERLYVMQVDDAKIALFWIESCCDFVRHAGRFGSDNSTRICGMKDIEIVETVQDKNDDEQWYRIRATRIGYGDLSKEFYEHEVDGRIEITIALPGYIPNELYDRIRDWKKERAKRRKYYDEGERGIVERYVDSHEYILG